MVTGAAGYLGGRVASLLGDDAQALVRTPVPWLPRRSQEVCDLLGPPDALAAAIDGASVVVHLAGHNEVVAAREPDRAVAETVAMAERVRDGARTVGARRVVYVSTVHVYGAQLQPGMRIDEATRVEPTSRYAQARLECEQVFADAADLEVVVLRLTNAVGAPADPSVDRWTLVASDLCRQAVIGRTMELRSDGLQWRDFIPLDDAARLTIGSAVGSGVPAGTYNLGSGTSTTVRKLAGLVQERVERTCGYRPSLVAPPVTRPPEEPYEVVVDKLARCGLRATLSLEAAIDEIVDHCVKHESLLRTDPAGA